MKPFSIDCIVSVYKADCTKTRNCSIIRCNRISPARNSELLRHHGEGDNYFLPTSSATLVSLGKECTPIGSRQIWGNFSGHVREVDTNSSRQGARGLKEPAEFGSRGMQKSSGAEVVSARPSYSMRIVNMIEMSNCDCTNHANGVLIYYFCCYLKLSCSTS